jgi:heme A synthase
VTAGTSLSLALASPALAAARDDGEQPGKPISTGTVLLLFVGAPLGLFLVITLLVVAPSLARGPRYRPGVGWWAAPVWFGGPGGDAQAAVESTERTRNGGGTSARW